MDNKRGHSWLRNSLFLVAMAALFLAGGIAMFQQQSALTRLELEIQQKEKEKEDAEMNVEYMNRLLQYTQSDEYIEQQARRILGWVREDERLFVDPEAGDVDIPKVTPNATAEENTALPEDE